VKTASGVIARWEFPDLHSLPAARLVLRRYTGAEAVHRSTTDHHSCEKPSLAVKSRSPALGHAHPPVPKRGGPTAIGMPKSCERPANSRFWHRRSFGTGRDPRLHLPSFQVGENSSVYSLGEFINRTNSTPRKMFSCSTCEISWIM